MLNSIAIFQAISKSMNFKPMVPETVQSDHAIINSISVDLLYNLSSRKDPTKIVQFNLGLNFENEPSRFESCTVILNDAAILDVVEFPPYFTFSKNQHIDVLQYDHSIVDRYFGGLTITDVKRVLWEEAAEEERLARLKYDTLAEASVQGYFDSLTYKFIRMASHVIDPNGPSRIFIELEDHRGKPHVALMDHFCQQSIRIDPLTLSHDGPAKLDYTVEGSGIIEQWFHDMKIEEVVDILSKRYTFNTGGGING